MKQGQTIWELRSCDKTESKEISEVKIDRNRSDFKLLDQWQKMIDASTAQDYVLLDQMAERVLLAMKTQEYSREAILDLIVFLISAKQAEIYQRAFCEPNIKMPDLVAISTKVLQELQIQDLKPKDIVKSIFQERKNSLGCLSWCYWMDFEALFLEIHPGLYQHWLVVAGVGDVY